LECRCSTIFLDNVTVCEVSLTSTLYVNHIYIC